MDASRSASRISVAVSRLRDPSLAGGCNAQQDQGYSEDVVKQTDTDLVTRHVCSIPEKKGELRTPHSPALESGLNSNSMSEDACIYLIR